MTDFLQHFDGSGRTPRKVQRDGLQWLAAGWHHPTASMHALSLPVGAGKSAVARAIQIAENASIVIPSNILMDQYTNEYRGVNYLKGKIHYTCHYAGISCHEWVNVSQQKACDRCPYIESRNRALCGAPTFYNPMSLYYLQKYNPDLFPQVLVIDEAHQLPQMVSLLSGVRLRQSDYRFDTSILNEVHIQELLKRQLESLDKLASRYREIKDTERVAECTEISSSLGLTLQGLKEEPQNYAYWFERGIYRRKPEVFLNVRPIRPPAFIMNRLLKSQRLVVMSGTLLRTDLDELSLGKKYRYLDLPSPIPKERRPILYRPVSYKMNVGTDPADIAASIDRVLDEFPARNTIIHTTYDRSKKIAKHLKRPPLVNTPENKAFVVEQFKREGGTFLASGCAEGLDLRDDICRLNIIPHLMRPSMVDPVVAKRKALPDGDRWFALETIKTTIQQYGRSTRHESDRSITVILDPNFGEIVGRYAADIPKYFREAIRWTK